MIKEIKRQRELLEFNNFIDNLHAVERTGREVTEYMFTGKRNAYNNYDCIYRLDETYYSIIIYIGCLRKHCSCNLEIKQIKQLLENKYNHSDKYNTYTAFIPFYD